MKTAVYICGLLKAFEHTFPSINKHLIEHNDCDVFVCVWDHLGISKKHSKVSHIKIKDRKVTVEDINKFSNVRDYMIIPFKENVTDEIGDVSVPSKVKHLNPVHYYSTLPLSYMVNMGVTMGDFSSYDRVVKIRPDLRFKSNFDIPTVFSKNNVIYSSHHKINKAIQVSDKFVGGHPNPMEKYCDLFKCLDSYWKNGNTSVGERLLKHHLKVSTIPVEYFGSNIKIVREDLK